MCTRLLSHNPCVLHSLPSAHPTALVQKQDHIPPPDAPIFIFHDCTSTHQHTNTTRAQNLNDVGRSLDRGASDQSTLVVLKNVRTTLFTLLLQCQRTTRNYRLTAHLAFASLLTGGLPVYLERIASLEPFASAIGVRTLFHRAFQAFRIHAQPHPQRNEESKLGYEIDLKW